MNYGTQLMQFANINNTDVKSSVDNAKSAIETYGLSYDDLGSVLDTFTYVSQQTGVSVDDLMTKAVDGAPQIKALGLSFDEGAQMLGQFEQAGVDGSAALSSLAKANVAYAKDGKTLEEGLNGTIDAILGAKNETEALTIASEVFGTKGATRKIDDASITGAKILNLDAGKITTGTLSAINIKGVNIEGSSLTSTTDDNQASINLSGGSQTFKNINGEKIGIIRPTFNTSGNANGLAITKYPNQIFSINVGNTSNFNSKPIIQIPAEANESNLTANFYGELHFSNIQPLAGRDIWVVSPSGKAVVLGVAGNSKLVANDSGVNIFGNFTTYNGSKNAAHVTRDGIRATPAYETAESYLGDIGSNYTRENCEVWVPIDEIFSDAVNTDIAYHVFLQAYDDAHFWVTEFKPDKFLVKSDKPMSRFAWEIKAKRRGYENERLVLQNEIDNKKIEEIYYKGENNG